MSKKRTLRPAGNSNDMPGLSYPRRAGRVSAPIVGVRGIKKAPLVDGLADPGVSRMGGSEAPRWSIDQDQENADWLKRDWIYPDNLEDLRKYLAEHKIDVADFKRTMRYKSNVDHLPWLKEL